MGAARAAPAAPHRRPLRSPCALQSLVALVCTLHLGRVRKRLLPLGSRSWFPSCPLPLAIVCSVLSPPGLSPAVPSQTLCLSKRCPPFKARCVLLNCGPSKKPSVFCTCLRLSPVTSLGPILVFPGQAPTPFIPWSPVFFRLFTLRNAPVWAGGRNSRVTEEYAEGRTGWATCFQRLSWKE